MPKGILRARYLSGLSQNPNISCILCATLRVARPSSLKQHKLYDHRPINIVEHILWTNERMLNLFTWSARACGCCRPWQLATSNTNNVCVCLLYMYTLWNINSVAWQMLIRSCISTHMCSRAVYSHALKCMPPDSQLCMFAQIFPCATHTHGRHLGALVYHLTACMIWELAIYYFLFACLLRVYTKPHCKLYNNKILSVYVRQV